jgi:hypothetical protein
MRKETGRPKRMEQAKRGICFERYPKEAGIGIDYLIYLIKHYYEVARRNDGSSEGVVLQIKGRELRELGDVPYMLIGICLQNLKLWKEYLLM